MLISSTFTLPILLLSSASCQSAGGTTSSSPTTVISSGRKLWDSSTVLFSAVSEAPLVGADYTFPGTWQSMVLPRFLRRGVYIVTTLQFGADIAEFDWQSSWTTVPTIRWGLTSNGLASLFRDEIPLTKYTEGVDFREAFVVGQEPSEIKFRLSGVLRQSPSLVGKASVRASINLIAYEISDNEFQKAFLERWGDK